MKTIFTVLVGALLGVYATADFVSNYDQLIRGVREVAGSPNNENITKFDWNTSAQVPMDESRQLEARNKQVVLGFMNEFFGEKNIESAGKYISSEKYIQHNPHVADGLEAVKTAAQDWFKGAPKEMLDIKRISAENDLVWVHLRSIEEGKPQAIVDIFRLEDGKIVEHWDVIQAVADLKHSANAHPMF